MFLSLFLFVAGLAVHGTGLLRPLVTHFEDVSGLIWNLGAPWIQQGGIA
jgi:hypothetical protein